MRSTHPFVIGVIKDEVLQKLGGKELKIRRATKENESRKRTKNTTKSTRLV